MQRVLFVKPAIGSARKTLKCVVLNARSVCNKLNELYYLIYGSDYDIIMITETRLNNRMPDAMLDASGRY